ncbi:MAG: hypothetical protein DCC55_01310 [Chloroflexi bacterium]|nr:MAG: hypothetical protein DCC55_01310 [Chloroflexota bacterium]
MKPFTRFAPYRWHGLFAALIIAAFVLLLYYSLLFTNRVLATGDILLYFYPYRDFAAAALREGRIPLWNPYLFLGAPFLANPQAAVLYPPHWPLAWLPVTKQVYWSAAIHTWLLGFGAYRLLRCWRLNPGAGLIGGLVLAGSGFYGGLLGHLNQMNGAAWLPWGVLIVSGWPRAEDAPPATAYRPFPIVRRLSDSGRNVALPIVTFALIVALMLLAGHTQTAYINLFGIGVWALWQAFPTWQGRTFDWERSRFEPIIIVIVGSLLGVLLSAAQLAPTVELSQLGLRSGGLNYADATSLSLKPLHLPWTLLPSYGLVELESIFGTPAYSEFIAYVGLGGLALAAVGAWHGRGVPRTFGLLFTSLGLLLALGRWNPLYFLLYLSVPGFDLFRTPARWMMLYTAGMAVLAAVGAEWVWQCRTQNVEHRAQNGQSLGLGSPSSISLRVLLWVGGVALTLELLVAARALPHTQPTAPQAVYDVRTAPAHLLTDPVRAGVAAAAMGRFLGMSTITYDPGDMGDWRRILREEPPAQVSEDAFQDFIIALKVQELLVPNLPLLWRIPAVDGFDGGVLPLRRYNEFLTLFVPPEDLVPDGRLREQVRSVPATRLLNLVNGHYLITDKVRDLWFEGLFYDRQIGARMRPGLDTVVVEVPQPFEATHVDLIGFVDGAPSDLARLADQNLAVATVVVAGDASSASFTLSAGGQPGAHLADGALDSPLASTSGVTVAYCDVEGGRQEYRVRLALPAPASPSHLTVQRLDTPFEVVVQAVTLFDQRTGMFAPLLPSDRGRFRLVHSGDVKIYENLDALPRAYLVHEVIGIESAADVLATLRADQFDPKRVAVVEGLSSFATVPGDEEGATIVSYEPERVEIHTHTNSEALLVLSDTAFPGWQATLDNDLVPLHVTNYLVRGVVVPPGEHTVVFVYRPTSWQRGLWLSGAGVVITLGLALWAWMRGRRAIGELPSPLL